MPAADKCSLHLPFILWSRDSEEGPVRDFENWKELQRWADRLVSECIPEAITNNTGTAKLLVMSATGDEIASGGDYVNFDTIVAQHGFDDVGINSWVHPVSSNCWILAYTHDWDSYQGGGIIRMELDGVLIPEGIILPSGPGQQGMGFIMYSAVAGQTGKIYVAQMSGAGQLCNANVQVGISDPTALNDVPTGAVGGYRISMSNAEQGIYVHRKLAGENEVVLKSVSYPIDTGWYQIRARIDDGRIRARIWHPADGEPVDWQIDVTDPEPLNPGMVGLATKGPFPNNQTGDQDCQWFTCSIEGGATQTIDFATTADPVGTAPPTGWVVLVEKGSIDWKITDVVGTKRLRYSGTSSSAGQWIGWQTAGTGQTMEIHAEMRQSSRAGSVGVVLRGVIE